MPILGAQHSGTRGLRLRWPTLHPTAPPQAACMYWATWEPVSLDGVRGRELNGDTGMQDRGEGGSGPRAGPPGSGQQVWPDALVPFRQNKPLYR